MMIGRSLHFAMPRVWCQFVQRSLEFLTVSYLFFGLFRQACSIDAGDTCTVGATATVTFDQDGEENSGTGSARGVDNLSNKENFSKIASAAGVDNSDVSLREQSPPHPNGVIIQ